MSTTSIGITHERYNEILKLILNYLQRISINQNSELEKEYYTYIEQDAEKLLEINNLGIVNSEIFDKVKNLFKMLIMFIEDGHTKSKLSYFNHIITDLYYIFKYVYEMILFMIENEFLVEN